MCKGTFLFVFNLKIALSFHFPVLARILCMVNDSESLLSYYLLIPGTVLGPPIVLWDSPLKFQLVLRIFS